jgi:dihydroxy-acid dehydratase
MPEMLSISSMVAGRQPVETVVLAADGRFSGVTRGPIVARVSPQGRSPIALIRDAELITIAVDSRTRELDMDAEKLDRQRSARVTPQLRGRRGVLTRSAQVVSSASKGSVVPSAGPE